MASSRRHFIRTASSAAAGLPAALAQPPRSLNDSIQFATIGVGGMGSGDTEHALATPGTRLVAVCDVYDGRLTRAREVWGSGIAVTRDYREVLARRDVDAVIIATPDHWHAPLALAAMEAGKDVYVEKPLLQRWQDGQRLIETAARTRRILQVGSQRVSSIVYQKAQDIFRSGAIGELNMVEAWWDRNSALGAWQYSIPPDASTQTVDWDRFLGAAPRRPFDATRIFRWRNYKDYGTGVAGDLFVHLFSGLHFVTGALGPTRIFASGGLRFWHDGRDVADVMLGLYDYPKTAAHPAFNLALRVNFANGAAESSGFRFTGSEGVMTIGSGVSLSKVAPEAEPGAWVGTFAKAQQEAYMADYRRKHPLKEATLDSLSPQAEERFLAPQGYSDHADHFANWFDSIRTRKPVVEDAAFGLRAAAPALLSNTSLDESRTLAWDPLAMRVQG